MDDKNIIYSSIEKMAVEEIDKLSSLVKKRKATNSKTSSNYYDKKISKVRNRCLKYIFELHKIDPEKTDRVINEVFKESIGEEE